MHCGHLKFSFPWEWNPGLDATEMDVHTHKTQSFALQAHPWPGMTHQQVF